MKKLFSTIHKFILSVQNVYNDDDLTLLNCVTRARNYVLSNREISSALHEGDEFSIDIQGQCKATKKMARLYRMDMPEKRTVQTPLFIPYESSVVLETSLKDPHLGNSEFVITTFFPRAHFKSGNCYNLCAISFSRDNNLPQVWRYSLNPEKEDTITIDHIRPDDEGYDEAPPQVKALYYGVYNTQPESESVEIRSSVYSKLLAQVERL